MKARTASDKKKVMLLIVKCVIVILLFMTATIITPNVYKRGIYQFTMYCFLLQFIADCYDL